MSRERGTVNRDLEGKEECSLLGCTTVHYKEEDKCKENEWGKRNASYSGIQRGKFVRSSMGCHLDI